MSVTSPNRGGITPTVKRCLETRAHYAHEWYTPLRTQCPGGPDEELPPAQEIALLRDLARRCHNGAPDPYQEFYNEGLSPLLDRLADALERRTTPGISQAHLDPGVHPSTWTTAFEGKDSDG